MIVWIVQRTYLTPCIMGVYSTLEKAKKSIKGLEWVTEGSHTLEGRPNDSTTYIIEPHEVDLCT